MYTDTPNIKETNSNKSSLYSAEIQISPKKDKEKDSKMVNSFKDTYAEIRIHLNPRPQNLSLKDFELGKLIGQGFFGQVYLSREIYSNFIVALKIIDKQKYYAANKINQLMKEIEIHMELDHFNIIKMYTFFYDSERVYLVLEYAPNGQLFNKLQNKANKRLKEKKAAQYIFQVLKALQYLHNKGILHRDIKQENLLLSNGKIKLSDFGWSTKISLNELRKTFCGTMEYLAPEIIKSEEYDFSVDIWSIGILCYELCCGISPFSGKTYTEIMNNISSIKISFPSYFSNDLKNLIEQILVCEINKRIKIEEILEHKWIKMNNP